ncbi:MAG: hydantoinase/oxoprolinase family protein [Anaerolineae bacterium]|nr:hydantoinase/oxoprolinase family protein [Anaerolineae bacterium]
MTIVLGIDTGGTYTDAVLVEQASGAVLAAAKALTTRHDLAIGIRQAVTDTLARAACRAGGAGIDPADIAMVGLSTTLATNAIVEDQGRPVCLILIGYDPDLIRQRGFQDDLVTHDVVYLRGGHDGAGDEVTPLDEQAARRAILERRDRVEAFAVSGYFAVRNPDHELRVRALIEELTASHGPDGLSLPVTCGHELTARLNSVRRATTVALNAGLIPLLRELALTVRRSLDELGIGAPLMIVKGDGSLVRAEWAMRRPIETILSGPAASVVGAWHLSRRPDAWVVDVGGTTTDIAVLCDGTPRLSAEGARVGRWQTMVEAVDMHTAGLGGDSQVCVEEVWASNGDGLDGDGLSIGPRRVVPLCLLASEHPAVVDELREQVGTRERLKLAGQFVLAQRRSAPGLSGEADDLLQRLDGTPRSLTWLVDHSPYGRLVVRQVEELVNRQILLCAGFTPTDALHVLGRFERWDADASRLGAELMAASLGLSVEDFCLRVADRTSDRVTAELVSKVLEDEGTLPAWERDSAAAALLARAMGGANGSDLDCRLTLRRPVVTVGAPVEAYLPRTARQLHTELVVPPHADVGNAVGAVAGGVVQRQQVLIQFTGTDLPFRVHLPGGLRDLADLEEAVHYAEQIMSQRVQEMARQAGAEQVEVHVRRADRLAPVRDSPEAVYLGTDLSFTAVGRPGLGHQAAAR